MSFIRDPHEIYAQSFSTIRAEADLSRIPADLEPVIVRMIHACGMTDLVKDIAFSSNAAQAGRDALAKGAPILADCDMVVKGISAAHGKNKPNVICAISDAETMRLAQEMKTTRAAAAVERWWPNLAGAVVAIGNAPTALFQLLDAVAGEGPKPALIIGVPVGFVGAAESKQALIERANGIPFITVKGRRGGSAIASAAVNAILNGK